MGFLQWLQDTTIAQWVGQSESLWAFPTVLVLHTVGLALLVGANAVIDLRVLGAARKVPLLELRKLSRAMWIGFSLSAASGITLFATDAERKAGQTVFYVKMGLIVLSLMVTVLIRRVLTEEYDSVESGTPAWAKALAASSLLLWAAVIVAGRMMALI